MIYKMHPTAFPSNTVSYENCRDAPCKFFLFLLLFCVILQLPTVASPGGFRGFWKLVKLQP